MIFALGFLVAGLLALLFLPAVWRRAVRLSTRRLEMLMPLSMDEVVAERDQVRAQAAVEQRRLEQKLEAMSNQHAQDLAEIGRRMSLMAKLDDELKIARQEIASLSQSLSERNAQLERVEAERTAFAQRVEDLQGHVEQSSGHVESLQQGEAALRLEIDRQRVVIAGLETKISALDLGSDTLQKALHEQAKAREVADERDFLRKEFESAAHKRDQLAQDLAQQHDEILAREDKLRDEHRARLRAETELDVIAHSYAALGSDESAALHKAIVNMGSQMLELQQSLRQAQQRGHLVNQE